MTLVHRNKLFLIELNESHYLLMAHPVWQKFNSRKTYYHQRLKNLFFPVAQEFVTDIVYKRLSFVL